MTTFAPFKSSYVIALVLAASVAWGGAACSSSDDSSSPPADTNADSGQASPDGSLADGGTTVAEGGTENDAALPRDGGLAATGDNLQIWGVTTDDYVVYSDITAGILYAVSATSGAPIALATGIQTTDAGIPMYQVLIRNKTVFFWTSADSKGNGPLSAWMAGASAPTVVSNSSKLGVAFASADGAHLLYGVNGDAHTGVADIVVSPLAASGATPLVQAMDVDGTSCTPQVEFAATGDVVLEHCQRAADGGSSPTYVSVFPASGGWTRHDLVTSANAVGPVTVNASGTQALVASADSGLQVFTLASQAASLVDAKATVAKAFFSADGMAAIYVQNDGGSSLARSTLTAPVPTKLAPGITGVWALTADGTQALAYKTFQQVDNYPTSDLFAASTSAAGTPTTLVSTVTAQQQGNDWFTTDMARVIYYDSTLANLNAVALTGGAPTQLTDDPWLSVFASPSSKVVFNTNWNESDASSGNGVADIYSADTASTAQPVKVATQANSDFYMTTDRRSIVYAYSKQAGVTSGLYVVPVP